MTPSWRGGTVAGNIPVRRSRNGKTGDNIRRVGSRWVEFAEASHGAAPGHTHRRRAGCKAGGECARDPQCFRARACRTRAAGDAILWLGACAARVFVCDEPKRRRGSKPAVAGQRSNAFLRLSHAERDRPEYKCSRNDNSSNTQCLSGNRISAEPAQQPLVDRCRRAAQTLSSSCRRRFPESGCEQSGQREWQLTGHSNTHDAASADCRSSADRLSS